MSDNKQTEREIKEIETNNTFSGRKRKKEREKRKL